MKKKIVAGVLALALLMACGFATGIFGAESGPGSSADPVVTQSYVTAQIDALKKELEDLTAKNQELTAQVESLSEKLETADEFIVVEIPDGGFLEGMSGTEMILRAGIATAVASSDGGVTDLSAATDLKDGASIEKNHLLIIPRSDGRGISCTGLCYVMVKGDYVLR